MRSLLYLLLTSLKNTVLDLLRKPAKLIPYLLLAALIFFSVFTSIHNAPEAGEGLPLYLLEGALFLLLTLFAALAVRSGLSSGNTFFDMSDVNLLFVSPLSPRKILVYGILRVMKSAALAGVFILFQSTTLQQFGVSSGGMLVIFLGFFLAIAALTILTLLIYSLANGNPVRKRIIAIVTALCFVPLVAALILTYLNTGDPLATAALVTRSPVMRGIPVAGWAAAGIAALLGGETAAGLGWFAATVGLAAAAALPLALGRADYYEDVLCATETAFEKRRAIAEGNLNAAAMTAGRKVKVTGTGLRGSGPSVFLFKHLRESFRESRFGPFGLSSLIPTAAAIVFAAFAREESTPIMILAMLLWMQVFLVGSGRGLKETYMPFLYLVPGRAFEKLIWSNLEVVVRTLAESVAIFLPVGLLCGVGPVSILMLMLTYTLFIYTLIGLNYASMRWLGTDLSAGILLTLYILSVLLLLLPGIVAGLLLGSFFGVAAGLSALAAWELLLGTTAFFLARSILHNCDMPVVKVIK